MISTLSNSMDISSPNNWPRVEELFHRNKWSLKDLAYGSVSDKKHKTLCVHLKILDIFNPHSAIAYQVLREKLRKDEFGLFLVTAHPAKFKESIESILKTKPKLPETLASRMNLPLLSHSLPSDYAKLRTFLLK